MYSISLYDNKKHLWTHSSNEVELMAGFLTALIPIVYDINDQINKYKNHRIETPHKNYEKIVYKSNIDADVNNRIKKRNVDVESVLMDKTYLDFSKYGIWVKSDGTNGTNKYNLYQFNSMDYVDGITSACYSFHIPVINVVTQLIFDYEERIYSIKDIETNMLSSTSLIFSDAIEIQDTVDDIILDADDPFEIDDLADGDENQIPYESLRDSDDFFANERD